MKFVLTSDLHYGFNKKTHQILNNFLRRVKQDKADAVIIAGDLISSKQEERPLLCQLLRDHLDIPIYVVHGNHDLWQYDQSPRVDLSTWYDNLQADSKTVYDTYNIHYLPMNPVNLHEHRITILGFDGWYDYAHPPTNDHLHMPKALEELSSKSPLTHTFLKRKAEEQLDHVVDQQTPYPSIVVTHFPMHSNSMRDRPYSGPQSWWQILQPITYIICLGHSHMFEMINTYGTKILNSGSDYNEPKRIIFEIGDTNDGKETDNTKYTERDYRGWRGLM